MTISKNKIKVAMLGPYQLDYTKSMGGAHIHLFDLTEQLKRYSDLELHVVSVSNLIKNDKTVNNDNLTVHYLSSPKLPRLITSLTIDQHKVIKKIKEINPDIVHAHCTAPLYGFPASLMSKKYPILLTVHGFVKKEQKILGGITSFVKSIIYGLMERYTLKTIQNIIVTTPYLAEIVESLYQKKAHVIPIGIRDDYFDIKNNEKKGRVLFVGGIGPIKGLLNLLKAINLVKRTIPTVNLHIVGLIKKKPYYVTLNEYISKNKLKRNITFSGFLNRKETKKEYGECSVFVLPSQEETQGLVLLEAMAAGKPVVATRVGGIPHIVEDNKTGFLVEYGNVGDLGEKIIKFLRDKDLRRDMGKNGKERAKLFSNEENTKRIYSVYKKLLR